ncbi:hypothetical protein [Paraburkholderia caledonica]|uniref:hypothetical protein n=1 Tax=Paraburkholderia caledonica TaxID=134536 RepID=UPI00036132C6|nr:hypothetical protein [Paraburkholderia caledonica]
MKNPAELQIGQVLRNLTLPQIFGIAATAVTIVAGSLTIGWRLGQLQAQAADAKSLTDMSNQLASATESAKANSAASQACTVNLRDTQASLAKLQMTASAASDNAFIHKQITDTESQIESTKSADLLYGFAASVDSDVAPLQERLKILLSSLNGCSR